MQVSRDALDRIRSSLGALAGRPDDDARVYARAKPRRAEITEDYYVVQELSKNRSTRWEKEPTGQIEITVPYDGFKYFTRAACQDVAVGDTGVAEADKRTATVGHLLLSDYEKTDLRGGLNLHDRIGAVPVDVPFPNGDDLDELIADTQTCIIKHDYQPQPAEIFPVQLSIDVYDPDSLDLPADNLLDLSEVQVRDVVKQIKRQVNFKNKLLLSVQVSLNLPVKKGQTPHLPRIKRVAIGWPTITSLQTIGLIVVGGPTESADRKIPVRYNPVDRCLEWEFQRENPSMYLEKRTPDNNEAGMVRYQSGLMLLSIDQPGELYQKDELEVHAEVEAPGYLLSGLEARLYDATGYKQHPQPNPTTHIHANARLMLSDAFAKRTFSPCQHLFFDEIVPSNDRIDDILTVLHDAAFRDAKPVWTDHGDKSGTRTWLLTASRRQGADPMELWILVEGRQFTVERLTRMDDLGYRAQVDTGALQLYIRGTLARDHAELARTMNALQQTLRERFARFHVRA
jgi:hypothetical protein